MTRPPPATLASPHIPFYLCALATLAPSCLPNVLGSIPTLEPLCWRFSPPAKHTLLSGLPKMGPSHHAGLSSKVTSSEEPTLTSKSHPTSPTTSLVPSIVQLTLTTYQLPDNWKLLSLHSCIPANYEKMLRRLTINICF